MIVYFPGSDAGSLSCEVVITEEPETLLHEQQPHIEICESGVSEYGWLFMYVSGGSFKIGKPHCGT